MRHFQKLIEGIDVAPILNALAVRPDLWNENDLRTSHPLSPHQAVDDIWLLFNDIPEDLTAVVDDCEVIPYRAWHELPHVRDLVLNVMRRVDGIRLGRVLISRLPPGGVIPAHIDQGAAATYYKRYHIALQSLPGAVNHSGNEAVCYAPGDVWWFDNAAEHAIVNNSADDRIAIVMDVRPC